VLEGYLQDGEKAEQVTIQSTTDSSDTRAWTRAENFDDWSLTCCHKPHLDLLTDPEEFVLTHRVARIGPIALAEVIVDSDLSMDRAEYCDAFRVVVLVSGSMECVHGGVSVRPGLGNAAVAAPGGLSEARWGAGTRMLTLLMDRWAVDDALSDALGRQVTSQVDFTPVMTTTAAPTQNWMNMLALLSEQLFRPDSLLSQPLVGLPFVDSLVRGFLFAADHSLRGALTENEGLAAPRAIRAAVEIIEENAHLPLTLSSIAARSCVGVRSLQQGFQRHLGTSPMAYLREVRLRRAHQTLLESDPSTTTVTSVAHRWGFNHVGRFAAAHAGRYREMPVETLRRGAFQRSA
jgi:AraC-like DNA-binding protein